MTAKGTSPLSLLALRASFPLPQRGEGLVVNGDLDDAEVEEHFDPQLALHLLREHKRRRSPDPAQRRGKAGAAPRAASNAEVVEALVKRLKAFALRVRAENADREPSPSMGEGWEGVTPEPRSTSPVTPPLPLPIKGRGKDGTGEEL